MKKFIIASFLLIGLVGVSKAGQNPFYIPLSTNKVADVGMRNAGVEKVTLVTSTTPALATDSAGNTYTSGLIYWVVSPSTAAAGSAFCEFRDTNTANSTSAHLIPNIPTVINTATNSTQQITNFDPPIPFYNGLSVNQQPLGTAVTAGLEWGIGIRYKK